MTTTIKYNGYKKEENKKVDRRDFVYNLLNEPFHLLTNKKKRSSKKN